jgi:hypothetical protein
MSDRGAKALAERLMIAYSPNFPLGSPADFLSDAGYLLGKHGLFIPDVTAHEPVIGQHFDSGALGIVCVCGAFDHRDGVSYFDHINP